MFSSNDRLLISIFAAVSLIWKIQTACHYSCFNCNQDESDIHCTNCGVQSTTHRTLDDSITQGQGYCVCGVGYTDGGNLVCDPLICDDSCKTCQHTATNCVSCQSTDNRLQSGSTCPCLQGYFDAGVSLCSECPSTCISCTDATTCTQCDTLTNHRQLDSNSDCICKDGYYDSGSDICDSCNYKCATCQTTSTNCLTCVTQSNSLRGAAPSCNCPTQRYYDDGQDDCQPCDYRCLTCSDQSSCLTCSANVDFRSLSSVTGFCQCFSRYYDNSNTICQTCHQTCLTCDGSTFTDCLTCSSSDKRVHQTSTSKCICQQGYYEATPLVSSCSACHSSCLTCSGSTQNDCQTCDIQRKRDFASGATAPSSCICIDGYYQNSNGICKSCHTSCLTCSGYNQCTACKVSQNTKLNVATGKCQCDPDQFWNSGTSACEACDHTCATCQDSATYCLSCPSASFRIYSQTLNTCNCAARYYDNNVAVCVACQVPCLTCNSAGQCLTCDATRHRQLSGTDCICSDGYYQQDANTQMCSQCHYSCNTCSDSTSCDDCVQFSNRQIVTDLCECSAGYFQDVDKNCQQCHYSCKNCQNLDFCSECQQTKFRQLGSNGLCKCMDTYYDDFINQLCLSCLDNCKTCTNSTQCQSCQATNFRVLSATTLKTCVCMDKYYDSGAQLCNECDYSCKTCSTSSANCLTCNTTANRYKSGSVCLCLNGFFDSGSQQCQKCHYSCKTCSDGTNCQTCSLSRTLGSSICECGIGTYDDGVTDACHSCHYTCQTCTDQNSCDTCDTNINRIQDPDNGPYCLCAQGFYDDGLDNQQCKACNFACLTCISSTQCETCDTSTQFRSLPGQMCPCITGYYSVDGQAVCQLCQYSCQTCTNVTQCLTCDSQKYRTFNLVNKLCDCQPKYYDDGSNDQLCIPCHYSCKTCETSQTNCLTCNISAHRQFNSNACDCKQYYFDDLSNQECLPCHYTCQTCSDSDSCDSCNAPTNFRQADASNNLCKCLQGYYDDNDKTCKQCHGSCLECTNSTACSDCDLAQNRQLNNSANHQGITSTFCVCLYKYFSPDAVTDCLPCHYSCEVCAGSAGTQCLVCNSVKQRTLNTSSGQCYCNQHFYDDGNSQQCQPCSPTCKTCQNDNIQCLTCYTEQLRQLNINQCVCLDGYYDSGEDVCQQCHYSCQTCSDQGQNNCNSCLSSNHRTISTGSCPCNAGYYDDGSSEECQPCDDSCLECIDDTSCSDCRSGQNRVLNNTANELNIASEMCICNYKYFSPSSDVACQECHYSCAICSGDTPNQCLFCDATAHRILSADNQCLCQDAYYDDGNNEECDGCHQLCATCEGPAQTQCLTCVADIFYLQATTTCYTQCPSQYFQNNDDYLCQPCSSNCLTCIDENQCMICKPNFPLYQDICYDDCPIQSTYEDTTNNICIDCPQNCLTCQSSSKCLSCVPDYFLDTLTPLCFPCHNYCKGCFGPANNQCQDCQYPLYFNNSQCFNISCPYGQYVDSHKGCVDCQRKFPNSLTCDINTPILCKQKYKLYGSSCIQCNKVSGYKISNSGKCAQICGDGVVYEVQCDDNNQVDGDGCSANCILEQGWICQVNSDKKSICQLTGEVSISLINFQKYGGQNKIRVDLEVSMPIVLQKNLFRFLIDNSQDGFTWDFSQNSNNLKYISFDISYSQSMQKKPISLSYGSPGNRRLLSALQISSQFIIESYPPAEFYSDQKISSFNQINNAIKALAIVLMILCLLCFVFPKRMYMNIFIYSNIPAEIFIVFGVCNQTITDWIKTSLKDIIYPSLVYGFNIYECCQTSQYLGYSTKISQNAGIVIVLVLVVWLIYGLLMLVSRNLCTINPKINMMLRTFIITFQLCVISHLTFSALNSLSTSTVNQGESSINVCIGIFFTIFICSFLVWIWILSYYSQPVEFIQNIEQQQNIHYLRSQKLKQAQYFFDLDKKTISSGQNSLNQTNKDFFYLDTQMDIKNKLPVNSQRLPTPVRNSPYKKIQQKYLSQWLIYDYVENYKTSKFSKYYLALSVTKLIFIYLVATAAKQSNFALLISIGVIHLLYAIYLIAVRPFKLMYTNVRIIIMQTLWIISYCIMSYHSFQATQNLYSSEIQYIILTLIAILIGIGIIFIFIDVIVSWRFQIWNRIEPCLVAMRLRNPRKILDSSQHFKKPHRDRKIVQITDLQVLQDSRQQVPANPIQPVNQEQKIQQQDLDAFFARMLKKQKLKRQYRRQRLLKNQKVQIS